MRPRRRARGSLWAAVVTAVCVGTFFYFGFLVGREMPRRSLYLVHAFVHDEAGVANWPGVSTEVTDGGPISVCQRLEWQYGTPSCECRVRQIVEE